MKNQVLVALVVIIVLAVFAINVGNASQQATVTLFSSGTVQQTPTPTPTPSPSGSNYYMDISGSNYQMLSSSQTLLYQSTSSSNVFKDIIGNCSSGSTIYVESGTYIVNAEWIIPSTVNGITIIFAPGSELYANNGLDSTMLFLSQSNNDLIKGITINGNAANQETPQLGVPSTFCDGIFIGGSNDEVENAYITNCRVYGFEVWCIATYGTASNSGIINSQIYNCGWNGVELGDANDYTNNTQIAYCSDVGISSYSPTGTMMFNNTIYDMNGTTGWAGVGTGSSYAIALEPANNSVVIGNTLSISSMGIECALGSWYNTIEDNTLTYCGVQGTYGITLGGDYNTVENNEISYASGNGIGIGFYESSFNTVSGNNVFNNGGIGIFTDSESNNNTISLNNVYGNGAITGYTAGIYLNGEYNNASQNQVYRNWAGFYVYGTYNFLVGNNVTANTYWQIQDDGTLTSMIANKGYNPVGVISTPVWTGTGFNYITDGYTGSIYYANGNPNSNSATWQSGVIYTNTESPKVLNITGGIVSSVTQNGVTLFTSTGCTVTLQPGDTFSVTFSTAPTIKVSGQ